MDGGIKIVAWSLLIPGIFYVIPYGQTLGLYLAAPLIALLILLLIVRAYAKRKMGVVATEEKNLKTWQILVLIGVLFVGLSVFSFIGSKYSANTKYPNSLSPSLPTPNNI